MGIRQGIDAHKEGTLYLDEIRHEVLQPRGITSARLSPKFS